MTPWRPLGSTKMASFAVVGLWSAVERSSGHFRCVNHFVMGHSVFRGVYWGVCLLESELIGQSLRGLKCGGGLKNGRLRFLIFEDALKN